MAADGQENVANEIENTDKTPLKNRQQKFFTLPVLQVIKESQQQHGLRHGDHQRYRQYCARRIRRMRKSLNFLQGDKKKVIPKKVTEAHLKDERFLYLSLVDAERAWSYSMQLKDESNTEPRKKYHMASKLKKAVAHAEDFAKLCESDRCDARTKLEAQAYCSWMKGSLQFQMENWKLAMESFASSKTIYEKLAEAFVDEIKEIYNQRVEEIMPNIRYCAYNIGDESAIHDLMEMRSKSGGTAGGLTQNLDALIEKTRERQAATMSEVTWRGRTVPIKNEQVRVFLLSVKETESQLEEANTVENKLSIYESLLKELIDAQQALKEDFKDDPTFRAIIRGQDTDGKVPNSVYLHTYLAYLRQTNTVQRNLLMIESLKPNLPGLRTDETKKLTKPQDLARLYDIIIQNLLEIPTLRGLEDDTSLTSEIGAQVLGYKAFRCFYIGESYNLAKKWREAIALYERAFQYTNDAIESYKNARGKLQAIEALQALSKDIDSQKYSSHAASILDTEDLVDQLATTSVKAKAPLSERLDQYYEDPNLTGKRPNLTQFPPDFEPIPCKPLFFDLAESLIEFPSLDHKMETKKEQKGGLTGFVKGWLWGGKK